jgi:ribosomal protein S18 acetylase RimI-like enzyme
MADPATPSALLAAFEAQVRWLPEPDDSRWTHERVGPLLRSTAPASSDRGGGVFASDLGGLSAAVVDAVIADQVAHFAPQGRPWEWKTYAHDEPADLRDRLAAAGLAAEDDEALVIGEVAEVVRSCAGAEPAGAVVVRELLGDGDFEGIAALKAAVWGGLGQDWVGELAAEKAARPDAMSIWVAVAEEQVVSAGWVRFHEGTEFASLWGGSTLAEWRHRGIYRTLVRLRAEQARARGLRYLQVDASPNSRPILERLGMHVVSTTTPYVWTPA